jgi:hypothetical protein
VFRYCILEDEDDDEHEDDFSWAAPINATLTDSKLAAVSM